MRWRELQFSYLLARVTSMKLASRSTRKSSFLRKGFLTQVLTGQKFSLGELVMDVAYVILLHHTIDLSSMAY